MITCPEDRNNGEVPSVQRERAHDARVRVCWDRTRFNQEIAALAAASCRCEAPAWTLVRRVPPGPTAVDSQWPSHELAYLRKRTAVAAGSCARGGRHVGGGDDDGATGAKCPSPGGNTSGCVQMEEELSLVDDNDDDDDDDDHDDDAIAATVRGSQLQVAAAKVGGEHSHCFECHVAYSVPYQVPVLLFNGMCGDRSLSVEECCAQLGLAQATADPRTTMVFSQMDHPVLGVPFVCLHPCKTSDLLGELFGLPDPPCPDVNLTLAWLSLVGNRLSVPGATVSRQLCEAIARLKM